MTRSTAARLRSSTAHTPLSSDGGGEEFVEVRRRLCQRSLIAFIQYVAPWFTIEEVHLAIAAHLEAVAEGKIDRLMIFMPPRAGKSQMLQFFEAWWVGKFPSDQLMMISYKSDRAEGFSKEVRDLIMTPEYQAVFPLVRMDGRSSARKRWQVKHLKADNDNDKDALLDGEAPAGPVKPGRSEAAGVGSGIAGAGFNLGVIDDPMSEQDKDSETALKAVQEWYPTGFLTRQQPERNAIILVMTRWSNADLAGWLLDKAKSDKEADQWVVLRIPAILTEPAAATLNKVSALKCWGDMKRYRLKEGQSFAPRRWPLKRLRRMKANMPIRDWNALYQQSPSNEEGAILKRKWWRKWPGQKPPMVEFIMSVYDTAIEVGEENDYTARSTWGVFFNESTKLYNAILLSGWQDKIEAADLPDLVREHIKRFGPDRVLIEKRASGHALIQELRRGNLPVSGWLPPEGSRHNKGKVPLAHIASIMLEAGAVWYMDTESCEDVINNCAQVPVSAGEHDDLANTAIIALIELRLRFWIETRTDDEDDEGDGPEANALVEDDEVPDRREHYPQETPYKRRIYG